MMLCCNRTINQRTYLMEQRDIILAERLRRQGLVQPLETVMGYEALVARLQPVAPVALTRPGDPPRLVHRTTFDDGPTADRMRADQTLVKGRFAGGTIAYVLAHDLELYANAFSRPLYEPNEAQRIVLDALEKLGPLTPRQIKEETGLLNKTIMPALHRLQEAFLVYEEQLDSDWERAWYDFRSAWPALRVRDERWPESANEVLRRFLHSMVFATTEQLKDWSHFPKKPLLERLAEMETQGVIVARSVAGLGEGWMLTEDADTLPAAPVPWATFMLHRADLLVRAHASELKRRYGSHEVLEYLLIDGSFQGVVRGHWRIGPYDVDDILLDLPPAELTRRRDEVLAAVATVYHPPHHRILAYAGEALQ